MGRLAGYGMTAKDSIVKEIVDLLVGSSYKKAEEPFTENWKDRTTVPCGRRKSAKGPTLLILGF